MSSTEGSPARAGNRSYLELILILGAMTAFGPLSIDMYLPAFPALQQAFDTTAGQIQLTLASFFIAFAAGQIFYGPLADRFGRKLPSYVGLAVFVLASLGCAFAQTAEQLVILRFLQALGAGGGVVIARAMVRDLFPPADAVTIFSRLMLVIGIAPMLAPLLGGYLLIWFGWQAIFLFLALYGLFCLLAVWLRLPESLDPAMRQGLSFRGTIIGYARLMNDRRFIGPALVGGLCICGMFVYITASPFVFIELLGLSPEAYGWVFGLNAFGFIAASQVNARVGRRLGPGRTLSLSVPALVLIGILLILGGAFGLGGSYGIYIPIFAYVACLGFIMPNTAALAMAPFGRNAGAASALLGTLQFALAAAASALAGSFSHQDAMPLALMVSILAFSGAAAYLLLCRNLPQLRRS